MQLSRKLSKAIAIVSVLSAASIILSTEIASAQPVDVNQTTTTNVVIRNNNTMGFGGAYVGGGVAAGITNGGQAGTSANVGGNIQGRVNVPSTPISARAAILFGPNNTAIMPIVTYDIPVARNTNVYVGGGYSFVEKDGQPTPIGNQDGPVVTLGAESSITRDIVVYGDAKLGINTYKNSPAQAVSLQAGLGYRF